MARFSDDVYYVGFTGLVNGIIKQAILDWCDAMYKLQNDPSDIAALRIKSDVERFFKSDWYSFMCKLDGKRLMRMVEEAFYNGEFAANRKI